MAREYHLGELEHVVVPTITDLLRNPEFPDDHWVDVLDAHPWLSEVLGELVGKTNEAWRASLSIGNGAVTFHIETPGYPLRTQILFQFKKTGTGMYVLAQ